MELLELSVSSHKSAVAITSKQAVDVSQVVPETARDTVPASAPELAIVVAVALATTLAPLNSTMIAVALPHIMQDFRLSRSMSSWVCCTNYSVRNISNAILEMCCRSLLKWKP